LKAGSTAQYAEQAVDQSVRLKPRVLWPLSLGLLFLVALFSFILFNKYQSAIEGNFTQELHFLQHDFESELMHHGENLKAIGHRLTTNPDLTQAIWQLDEAQRNTAMLDNPILGQIRNERHIEHFSLYSPEGVLLASSCPAEERQGQQIDNPLLHQAITMQSQVSGLHLGRCGELPLVVITPWQDAKGQLLGYLELGDYASRFIQHMQESYRFDGFIAVDKTLLSRDFYQHHASVTGSADNWDQYPERLVIWQSPNFPVDINLGELMIAPPIATIPSQHKHRGLAPVESHQLQVDGHHYIISTLQLWANGDRPVGELYILRDITDVHRELVLAGGVIIGFSLVIGAILFLFFYHLVSHVEKDIKDSHVALERAEQQWNRAFDAVTDIIFLHDREGRLLRVNRAYAKLAGQPFKELIGTPYWHHFPKLEGPLTSCMQVIGVPGKEATEEFKVADGRIYRSRGFTVLDEAGDFLLAMHIVEDLTKDKQMEEQLRHEVRAHRVISNSNSLLIHATDEAVMLQQACELICEEPAYPLAWVGLKTDQGLRIAGHAGVLTNEDIATLDLTWTNKEQSKNMALEAVRLQLLQHNQDVQNNASCKACQDLARKYDYHSVLAYPLVNEGLVHGALTIAATEANAFTKEEIALFKEMADDLAFGIISLRRNTARQRAEQSEHETLLKLESSMHKTVQAIANAVEVRDPYTAGHQKRVALLATAIAKQMGLDEATIMGLRLGAAIHDIGKIYIPADILNRPGRLTEYEFDIIKAHPQVGYDIIKEIDFPWPVSNMVLMHHERLDGSGYPQGLKGDQIPLEVRILSIADAVEAIDSHRPYRPKLGIDFALEEIQAHKGTWYDAAAVDACVRLIREQGAPW